MTVQIELNANGKNGDRPVKIYTRDIDHMALAQLKNIAKLPVVFPHVAAMPDVHAGVGATVGSVIPTREAIIPAAVGVDIGCGMNAVQLSLNAGQLPNHLRSVRNAIEEAVPVGKMIHPNALARNSACKPLSPGINWLFEKHPAVKKMIKQPGQTWIKQMGTLGSGNHFIELCLDENSQVWIMLHSGSRGIGNAIGRYFIQLARKDCSRLQRNLPDKDLAYFQEGTDYFEDYVTAVDWAQRYALANREQMMRLVIDAISPLLPPFRVSREAINCHHNYVQKEEHYGSTVYVTRKGAISAREGELGIIPGSMGARSYIIRGKGSTEALCSCSHGAGRRMSRGAAKNRFTRRDIEQQTRGVECRKDAGVLDEIPSAYKDIDQVIDNQKDLVEIVHTLKQVVCVKG